MERGKGWLIEQIEPEKQKSSFGKAGATWTDVRKANKEENVSAAIYDGFCEARNRVFIFECIRFLEEEYEQGALTFFPRKFLPQKGLIGEEVN